METVASPLFSTTPLALYLHFPWCIRKCPYCDFNSHESPFSSHQEAAYLTALIADFEASLPMIEGRPVVSIFIGGGTPSLMAGRTVDALLTAIRRRVSLLPDAEITIEANPGASDAARFAAYRDAGVNRLSLGIQSFNDAKLNAIGRIHSGSEARRAIALAQCYFERVNLDMMVALPGQTLAEAECDIDTAIATGVSHLSAYHLTLEPNTPFYYAPPLLLPDEDSAADMQDAVEAQLATAGFEHYETSAFAKLPTDPELNQQCRHNLNYWTFGDYLGIGAGAHSKISDHAGIRREARPRHPKDYLANPTARHWLSVTQADLPGEFMMNALRLTAGVPMTLFLERTRLPYAQIEKSVVVGRREGLLEAVEDQLRPTAQGRRFLNRLVMLFLSDA